MELEQYQREKFLPGKGVSPDDTDYYVFKIGETVSDTTDFETAASQFLKGHAPKEPEKSSSMIRGWSHTGVEMRGKEW